jgi:hypothetical protein
MKCLRIYSTPDGESHFGEVDVATTLTPLFPNEARFRLTTQRHASALSISPQGCAETAVAGIVCMMILARTNVPRSSAFSPTASVSKDVMLVPHGVVLAS